MKSGKVMGEEDTELLLNQGARKAGGEKGEVAEQRRRMNRCASATESTVGSQGCFRGWHSQGQRPGIKSSISVRWRRWKRLRKSRPRNLQLCSSRD